MKRNINPKNFILNPYEKIPDEIRNYKGKCSRCEFYSGICADVYYGDDVSSTSNERKDCYSLSFEDFVKLSDEYLEKKGLT